MTAKEYLKQARTLDMEINAKVEELYQLRLKASCVQSVAMTERVQGSHSNSSNQIIDKIVDLQNEINKEIDNLVDLKEEIREKIKNVYNPVFVSVLIYRYINNFTLEQISEKMNKEYRTICRWHGEALQIFRKENSME